MPRAALDKLTERPSQIQACLLHGSRTPSAIGVAYLLAKSGASTFVAWEGRYPKDSKCTGRKTTISNLTDHLFVLKQDDEDVGDMHVVQTTLDRTRVAGAGRTLVVHVCAENIYPELLYSSCEADMAYLESMETGHLETRKSLRLMRTAHDFIVQRQAALVYLLPSTEAAADSSVLGAAAHKTSRVVDQTPLRHDDGLPCTFALHPVHCCAKASSLLVWSWLARLAASSRERWIELGASSVITLCSPEEGYTKPLSDDLSQEPSSTQK